MRDRTHDRLGLLMAPHDLPACFSFEEEPVKRDRRTTNALAPSRLRAGMHRLAGGLRHRFASRATAHRNLSAAAW